MLVTAVDQDEAAEDGYFFLDVGGDSVTALELSAAVEEAFGFELPLEVLVMLPIGGVADLVATAAATVRAARPRGAAMAGGVAGGVVGEQ